MEKEWEIKKIWGKFPFILVHYHPNDKIRWYDVASTMYCYKCRKRTPYKYVQLLKLLNFMDKI